MRAKLRFGLALFSGAVVDQNFEAHAGRLERLTDLLRNGPRSIGWQARRASSAARSAWGSNSRLCSSCAAIPLRALGEGRGHIFLKSNGDRTITWQTLAAGEDPLVVQSSSARPRPPRATVESNRWRDFNPFGMPEPADPSRLGNRGAARRRRHRRNHRSVSQTRGSGRNLGSCIVRRRGKAAGPRRNATGRNWPNGWKRVFSSGGNCKATDGWTDLTFVTTNTPPDANRPEFVRPLEQADAMWFCGGDQKPLADLFVDRLRPTLFQQEASNIVRRGGVVGGRRPGWRSWPT